MAYIRWSSGRRGRSGPTSPSPPLRQRRDYEFKDRDKSEVGRPESGYAKSSPPPTVGSLVAQDTPTPETDGSRETGCG